MIDETLTLFKVRGSYRRALAIGPRLIGGQFARLIWVQQQDVHSAWEIFRQFRDKQWSFTDCVSYVVIQRFGIQQAMAFDEHFHQFGITQVVPE